MNILLVDIDSKIPNLALLKCEKYYKDKGHNVNWDLPIFEGNADKIFVSCIFKKNRSQAEQYESYSNALIGGSGYDLLIKLPPEIEAIKPRVNFGFTLRGCIRKCEFCVVPEKEGGLEVVGDLLDLWDGKSKDVTILDNNILADSEHFKLICQQARDNKIRLDFNQGLDHRLLTPDICFELARTSIKKYRFAYDHISMRRSVNRAIYMLRAFGINQAEWYVLVGFNTSLREDVKRINHLRLLKHRVYVQRYVRDRKYIPVASWANNRRTYNMTLMQYMKHPLKEKYNREFLDLYISEIGLKCMEGPRV